MSLRTANPKAWYELLEARHLGEILGRSERTARRNMAAGLYGPVVEIAGTRYVRRAVFLAFLEQRERDPAPAMRPPVRPQSRGARR